MSSRLDRIVTLLEEMEARLRAVESKIDNIEAVESQAQKKLDKLIDIFEKQPANVEPVERDIRHPFKITDGKEKKVKVTNKLLITALSNLQGPNQAQKIFENIKAMAIVIIKQMKQDNDLSSRSLNWSKIPAEEKEKAKKNLEERLAAVGVRIDRAEDRWIANTVLRNKWANRVERLSIASSSAATKASSPSSSPSSTSSSSSSLLLSPSPPPPPSTTRTSSSSSSSSAPRKVTNTRSSTRRTRSSTSSRRSSSLSSSRSRKRGRYQ
ncbi:uncharacterized protein BX664DRAFT_328310 [Halteromyces radiatus]|uniref:uncharacterized protein n=1 Tax=Halteromyces radiatus TaxID=101107 RepID=UPI002220541D|nr:uncharacterized protein BX664DRAFT_328310 [Halteromyces radiatus]KAI8092847.1 hypothetical protein BX664DRAFT_328310 [Halteromyces radiatus]